MSLRPIVSKGYSQTRGSNIWRTEVQGGLPRQGRDTYFEPVPISVTLVVSSLGRQAFYSFLNNIDGGTSSFIMPHDTGMGIEDHQVLITSTISDSTDDGKNWVITFTATAERTAIQEDTCLTKNLPDLYGCYGDCLGSFLKIYANYETTFPRIWSNEGPAGYPPINLLALTLDSRIIYDGPQIYYINRNGNLVQSAADEWPLTFIDGVAVGRVPPENSVTNYALNTGDITTTSWVKTRASVSKSQKNTDVIAGKTYDIIPTTDNGTHFVSQSLSNSLRVGEQMTISYIAKASGYDFFRVRVADNIGFLGDVVVNTTTGNIIVGEPGSTVQSLGGSWFRITETVTIREGGDISLHMQGFVDVDGERTQYSGDGVSGAEIALPQLEYSSVATSPIITNSSAVTRPAASAKVVMNGATSIDITYSDGSTVNVPAVDNYASVPQADSAWGSKYITRIDFNVDG